MSEKLIELKPIPYEHNFLKSLIIYFIGFAAFMFLNLYYHHNLSYNNLIFIIIATVILFFIAIVPHILISFSICKIVENSIYNIYNDKIEIIKVGSEIKKKYVELNNIRNISLLGRNLRLMGVNEKNLPKNVRSIRMEVHREFAPVILRNIENAELVLAKLKELIAQQKATT